MLYTQPTHLTNPDLSLPPPECQYNRPYNQVNDDDDDDALEDEEVRGARGRDSECSGSSRRSSLGNEDADFAHKVHRLQTAKQKLRQLQELVAMVQVRGLTRNRET